VSARRGVLRAAAVAALVLAGVMAEPAVVRAIYVSPTTIFLDARSPDAQITIGNSDDTPEEATIEVRFGFPDADSAGTPYIRFVDDPGPEFPSAADWIRPFPQRVRLEPGSQQIVRLLARPPDSLPDGEYWARLIVTGRGAVTTLPSRDSVLHLGLDLQVRLIASVLYRKGHVTTGIAIRGLEAEAEGDSLAVWAHLEHTGNAAFLGEAIFDVTNARGGAVRTWTVPLSVHVPVRRRFVFPLDSLQPGDYRVRLRMRAERTDLPGDRVLPAAPATDSVAVRVL